MEMETPEIEKHDSLGKMIGVQTAILAVLLSIFTIYAHREHTNTLLYSNETSNSWAHYQAKRIRAYQVEMNTDLIKLMAPNSIETAKILDSYAKQSGKYEKDLTDIKAEADQNSQKAEVSHRKAGYFDLAEGLLEIAVILSSLYFISRKKLFPALGLILGFSGLFIGVIGLFIK